MVPAIILKVHGQSNIGFFRAEKVRIKALKKQEDFDQENLYTD